MKLTKLKTLLFTFLIATALFGSNQAPSSGNANPAEGNSAPSSASPPTINTPPPSPINSVVNADQPPEAPSELKQFILPGMVLFFGLAIFILLSFKNRHNHTSDLKIESFTLIIIGVLFIISTTSSSNFAQNVVPLYAPAFGLLGTIAGYILGKSSEPVSTKKELAIPSKKDASIFPSKETIEP